MLMLTPITALHRSSPRTEPDCPVLPLVTTNARRRSLSRKLCSMENQWNQYLQHWISSEPRSSLHTRSLGWCLTHSLPESSIYLDRTMSMIYIHPPDLYQFSLRYVITSLSELLMDRAHLVTFLSSGPSTRYDVCYCIIYNMYLSYESCNITFLHICTRSTCAIT